MRKKIDLNIGIDIDETVRKFKKQHEKVYGIDPDILFIKDHRKDPELSKKLLLEAEPFPGARDFARFVRERLPKILEKKFRIPVETHIFWVTAQASKINATDTLKWLEKVNLMDPAKDFYISTSNKGKTPIHILIDDADRFLKTLNPHQVGIKTKFKYENGERLVDYEKLKKELIEKSIEHISSCSLQSPSP